MFTPELKKFLKSTLVVLAVSTIISYGIYFLNKPFLPAFLLSTGIQYFIFSVIKGSVDNYFIQQTRQKQLDKLENLSTILECASCKHPNICTFIPDQNERIEFTCDSCGGKNVVNINFTVARVTDFKDPISLTPLSK